MILIAWHCKIQISRRVELLDNIDLDTTIKLMFSIQGAKTLISTLC